VAAKKQMGGHLVEAAERPQHGGVVVDVSEVKNGETKPNFFCTSKKITEPHVIGVVLLS
jgi:hypothetical protein